MPATSLVTIGWRGRPVDIEYAWVGGSGPVAGSPWLVFLHEGLGSVSMWRDFPEKLCAALSAPALIYSRPGYGRSTPRAREEHWDPDFMHRQAHEVLPALLTALGVDSAAAPPWLFGHSDGGSIALLYAARFPTACAGVVALAPHILVEDRSIESIEKARTAYLETSLRERLGRYHEDPDSAFWGWNDIWLDPRFRTWNITEELRRITCPVLAIQGIDDDYGTLVQIRGIREALPATELLEIPACGHSPHRDQPAAVIEATRQFLERHAERAVT